MCSRLRSKPTLDVINGPSAQISQLRNPRNTHPKINSTGPKLLANLHKSSPPKIKRKLHDNIQVLESNSLPIYLSVVPVFSSFPFVPSLLPKGVIMIS